MLRVKVKVQIEGDHKRECAEAEWQNQEVYPLQIFTQTKILIISSFIKLDHDMSYQNMSLCSDYFNERVKVYATS
jgi:hypothetical protein